MRWRRSVLLSRGKRYHFWLDGESHVLRDKSLIIKKILRMISDELAILLFNYVNHPHGKPSERTVNLCTLYENKLFELLLIFI